MFMIGTAESILSLLCDFDILFDHRISCQTKLFEATRENCVRWTSASLELFSSRTYLQAPLSNGSWTLTGNMLHMTEHVQSWK